MTPIVEPDERRLQFSRWYGAEAAGVTRTVTVLCRSPELAQEVTAEAFARAWADWDRVRTMASPGGWVHRVAVNLAQSRFRRRRLEQRVARRRVVAPAMAPPELPDDRLWEAVAGLPPRARLAIALRYVADLPEADVAAAMGVSRGTVASTLSSARRRLAEQLTPDAEAEEVVR